MATSRMIAVGLDGATFNLIKPWAAEGKLPTFARVLAEGAHAELRSTLPALAPSAWTSAATGKNPGKHNIYDFDTVSGGGTGKVPLTPADLRSRRVWDIATAYGKRAGVVHLPLTYPPEHLDGGFVIAGSMTPKGVDDYTFPLELKEELAENVPGYRFDADADALKIGDVRAFRDDAFDLQRVHTAETLHLIDNKEWDLLWVVFPMLDKVQRFFWHFTDPSHPAHPGPNAFSDTILQFYGLLDDALAEILQRLDDDTGLLVMSDHGSCAVESYLLITHWLEEAGFLAMADEGSSSMKRALGGLGVEAYALVRALRRSGLGWLPKLVPRARSQGPMAKASLAPIAKNVDWSSTRVYCPSAAGSELRVNLRGREAHGIVDPDDFERVCHEVRQALLQLTDPATGRKVVRAVHLRHEIYQGPHAENGADLLVETTDPYCLVDDVGATSIVPAGQSTGERTAHDLRNGIFMLAGTAARRGAAIPELDICDVAPTLLHLIGLPVQDDMDGTVAAAALTESHRAAHPIQTDQLTLPPETEQVEIDDRDRRAIDGAPEGLGYL